MPNNLSKLQRLSQYLSETESTLSFFWNITPAMFCITENGKFIKINPSCYKILGYTQEELLGRDYKDFIISEDIDKTIKIEDSLDKNIECFNFVNRYRHKNGSTVFLSWSAKFDKHSQKLFSVATDVTEEHSLKYKLTGALANAPFGIFLTDKNGKCVYVNERWKSVTGLTEEQALGDGWSQGIAEEERGRIFSIWLKYSREAEHSKQMSFICDTKYKNVITGHETPVKIMSYSYGDRDFIGYVDFCLCFDNEKNKHLFNTNG